MCIVIKKQNVQCDVFDCIHNTDNECTNSDSISIVDQVSVIEVVCDYTRGED